MNKKYFCGKIKSYLKLQERIFLSENPLQFQGKKIENQALIENTADFIITRNLQKTVEKEREEMYQEREELRLSKPVFSRYYKVYLYYS